MNIHRVLVVLAVLASISGCYLPISGHVIDAETQQPIEGAVVLAEWTKTKGYGFTYTESYKVVEAVSDKDGKVKIEGCFFCLTNPPDITVYKKGYVAWSNRWIFPGMRNRSDAERSESIFKLEHFKKDYSYIEHTDFITSSINSSINFEAKKNFYNVFRWEDQMASKERDEKARKTHR